MKKLLRNVAVVLTAMLSGCASWFTREPTIPMRSVEAPAASEASPLELLIILPGRGIQPEDCVDYGILEPLGERTKLDVIIPDAHLGYYLNKSVTDRLQADVLEPALSQNDYDRVYVAGVSLGALGAFFLERDWPGHFYRIYLIAPFLGQSEALIESLEAAPSLAQWTPPPDLDAEEYELELWTMLAENARGEIDLGEIWLIYGEDDRYGRLQKVLGRSLPPDRVITAPGGHEWEVWIGLWEEVIRRTDLNPSAN